MMLMVLTVVSIPPYYHVMTALLLGAIFLPVPNANSPPLLWARHSLRSFASAGIIKDYINC